MLVVKQQTKRKSANRQVTTPSVKPNCVEANFPFDLLQPVRIDHPSICTSDTALLSNELLEPPFAPEKEPTIHAIQVDDADKENWLMTTTSTTKEPTLSGEILMVNDCLETHEDGDLTTVVLADKGKGVDPQEYGGAPYYPNSMIVPAGTKSTGGSDFVELIGVHRDKGKNIDPEGKENGMAKYDPGPSRIDFDDHRDGAMSFQKQSTVTPLESFDPTDLNDELPYDPTLPRRSWRPKISHFRFIVFSMPLAFLGTVQAVSNQKGSVTISVTTEWISSVVIFLLNLGPLILYLRVSILASTSILPSVIRYHTGRFIGAIERRASFCPLPFPMAVLIQTLKLPKDIL